VETVAKAGLAAAKGQSSSDKALNKTLTDIATLQTTDGRSVKEVLAMAVGSLRENLDISRIEMIVGPKDSHLIGYSHPK
uniref:Uncharacterized protein n=1 Tax=Plectus sambesii TaxID=2011161 RepID=A0A914VGK7_9BILA